MSVHEGLPGVVVDQVCKRDDCEKSGEYSSGRCMSRGDAATRSRHSCSRKELHDEDEGTMDPDEWKDEETRSEFMGRKLVVC